MNPQSYVSNAFPIPVALPATLFPSVFYAPVFGGVQAGFSAPSENYMEKVIDLNEHLVKHPAATFYVRINGESMTGAYIPPGSIVVVDRSLTPQNGCIVVAVVDGDFVCKRYEKKGMGVRLLSENPKFKPITFSEGNELLIWGVVTAIIIEAKMV